MLTVLFMLIISVVVVLGSASPLVLDLKNAQDLSKSKSSYYTAETGTEDIYYRIKEGKTYSTPEVYTVNGGTVSVSVTTISAFEKEIIASSDVSSRLRKSKLNIVQGVGSDFSYGAQIGDGGLVMNNNSKIVGLLGAVGNVFSNGPIVGGNNTEITGTAIVATGVVLDPTAQSVTQNTDITVGRTSPNIDYAQQFTAGTTGALYKVSLYIKKPASDPPISDIQIVADDGSGAPLGTALASTAILASSVGTSYGWVEFTFASPASLILGNKYWIVLNAGTNNSNYWTWGADSSAEYGGGFAKFKSSWSTGGLWTAISQDLNFKVYYGTGTGSITNMGRIGVDAHANTIANSTVVGTAYCKTASGITKPCNPSLPDPTPVSMSLSEGNLAQWRTEAEAGGVINGNCAGTVVAGCSLTMGPKKINGNLTISASEPNPFIITGVLYVTGNITINGDVRCHANFGISSCILIADGWIDISNNRLFTGSGTAGSYVLVVSAISGCNGTGSSCAGNYSGINISNGVQGGIFFTLASMIHIGNAQVKAVNGYKVEIVSTGIVQYEDGVANTLFSSGPSGGWNVGKWKEVQ